MTTDNAEQAEQVEQTQHVEQVQKVSGKSIEFSIDRCLIASFNPRIQGTSVVVNVPRGLARKMAVRHGLTLREFLVQFAAIAYYDGSDSILYQFKKKDSSDLPL